MKPITRTMVIRSGLWNFATVPSFLWMWTWCKILSIDFSGRWTYPELRGTKDGAPR